MVPVSQVFDRFPRLVRDLSLKKGKKIDLLMEGKEIEVDRTVLDEIGEPLIHLLRNSVDHGIESPDERVKLTKDDTGKITLSAQRNGNHVLIEIKDDGAGINPEKIKASAIKKGFANKSETEKMSKEQLINMIFLPGFSTAKEVTDTSGRGVGMDVVKTKISALGGTVHIESQVGKGTIRLLSFQSRWLLFRQYWLRITLKPLLSQQVRFPRLFELKEAMLRHWVNLKLFSFETT